MKSKEAHEAWVLHLLVICFLFRYVPLGDSCYNNLLSFADDVALKEAPLDAAGAA